MIRPTRVTESPACAFSNPLPRRPGQRRQLAGFHQSSAEKMATNVEKSCCGAAGDSLACKRGPFSFGFSIVPEHGRDPLELFLLC
jgi:hypothetical protein